MEAAEDLGYGLEGVKRFSEGPSPREPVAKQVTDYLLHEGELRDHTGSYSGVRVEYTPLNLRVESVPEDDMPGLLKTGGFAVGSAVAEDVNNHSSMIGSVYKRKDFDVEIAEEVIEMMDAKMDFGVPEPDIIDVRNEQQEIFRYTYPLKDNF